MKFISIQEAINKGKGKVAVRGWIYRERGSNKLKFLVLRDSTNIIQCVLKKEDFAPEGVPSKEGKEGKKQWSEIDKLQVEASVEIEGTIKADKRAPTGYEISVDKLNIVGLSNDCLLYTSPSPRD